MKPMTNPRAIDVLKMRVQFLEAHLSTHPANQLWQREEIYALQLGIAALNEQEFKDVGEIKIVAPEDRDASYIAAHQYCEQRQRAAQI